MTAFQLTAGPWAVPILAIGVAGFLGSMAVTWWAGRHKDAEPPRTFSSIDAVLADLDAETEARIWKNVQAAINEDRTGR